MTKSKTVEDPALRAVADALISRKFDGEIGTMADALFEIAASLRAVADALNSIDSSITNVKVGEALDGLASLSGGIAIQTT